MRGKAMPIEITMPALSPTMTEGTLAKWLKKEGDMVKAGQTIAEIETDKATMEVEAVDEGKLLKILIPGGTQGIKVNTPIAVLAAEGEENLTADAAMAGLAKKNGGAGPAAPPVSDKQALAEIRTEVSSMMKGAPQAKTPAAPASGERVFASPLAKRM